MDKKEMFCVTDLNDAYKGKLKLSAFFKISEFRFFD